MKYDKIVKGIFIERPNRFIAKVNIDGMEHTVHVICVCLIIINQKIRHKGVVM